MNPGPKTLRLLLHSRHQFVPVNAFRETEEGSREILNVEPAIEREQVERLREFRASRDAAACATALEALKRDAREDRNLMPSILRAVGSSATLQEIVEALKTVFGEYRASG